MNNDHLPFLEAWDTCAARAATQLSPRAVEAARRSWFDTAAAMAAGGHENCTRAAFQSCAVEPDALGAGDAALVLGTASHALDYDDVCMLATCHPSAPVVATLMAILPLVERARPETSYGQLLAAYALGTETMLRLGQWLGFRHYTLGFHATSTLGAIGSAASAARMLGLTSAQAHDALAIAASSASGLRANFGSDTKPLHVGFATAAGVRAATLARSGARGCDDVWGPTGFPFSFSGGEMPPPLAWTGTLPWALESPGFEHKRFPSCYMTHRLIAGVLAIRARQPQRQGEPVLIDVELPKGGTAPLKYPRPHTGLQAKFSGPYCAAEAWTRGRVDLASFSDTAVLRTHVAAEMERVIVRERDATGETLDTAPVLVTVSGSGWSDSVTVDWAPGSFADPMSREELLTKWHDCAAHGGMQSGEALALALLDGPLDTPVAAAVAPLRAALLDAITTSASTQFAAR